MSNNCLTITTTIFVETGYSQYNSKMKALIILLFSTSISASCIGTTNGLIGKGILTFSWFNIELYEIAYYKTKHYKSLKLKFKKDISAYYLKQGWDSGLKHYERTNNNKIAIEWLKINTPDTKKNDCIEYKISDDKNVSFIYNGKTIAQTTIPEVKNMIHDSWIGDIPVDTDLKKKLLGAK
ncbi:MAG: hypothetical protein ACI9QD_000580 [Thermoproteota archaeon]|jgi:hypothetical protein